MMINSSVISMQNSISNTTICYYNQSMLFFYNMTVRNLVLEEEQCKSRTGLVTTVLCGIGIIILNSLILTAIVISPKLHFPFYYLLGNLALTDICVGISYLVITCQLGFWKTSVSTGQWFLRQGLTCTSLMASLLSLMTIALERQQTIFTMQLHSKMSNRRVIYLILAVWIIAILFGLLPTLGWNCFCDLSSCSGLLPLFSRSYVLTISLLSLLTMSAVVILYMCIFIYVWRKIRQIREHTGDEQNKQTIIDLMITVSLVIGCFVLCWTPALVLLLLDGLNNVTEKLLAFELLFLTMVPSNSYINPIIYTCRDKEVRSSLRRIFCYFFPSTHRECGII